MVDLSGNKLGGAIPADLFRYSPALEDVHLGTNSFKGPLPNDLFADQPNLKRVELQRNVRPPIHTRREAAPRSRPASSPSHEQLLDGEFPDLFNSTPNVTKVNLAENNFVGTLSLSALERLESLNASRNNFEKFALPRLASLRYLDLARNEKAAPWDMPRIQATAKVVDVGASNARIDQDTFEEAKGVTVLILEGNRLTGALWYDPSYHTTNCF